MSLLNKQGAEAKAASYIFAIAGTELKNRALAAIADNMKNIRTSGSRRTRRTLLRQKLRE